MSVHDDLVKTADEAINQVFNDNSVGFAVTRESLEALAEQIDSLLAAIET